MASKVPIIIQFSIPSFLIQLFFISALALLFYQIDKSNYILYALFVFIAVLYLLRNVVPREHRKGISMYKRHKYELAIPYFQRSYDFFRQNKWIDKYRFITMLSSSRNSYAEMALLNIAFCQSQIGRKEEAIDNYKRVLKEFGDSEIALSALRMLE